MAKGIHYLSAPFQRRSKVRDEGLKYLDGTGTRDNQLFIPFPTLFTADIRESESEDNSDAGSVSSFSTNATMDNIPGPGRMLDRMYQHLGRKLERCIYHFSISSLHPNKILQCLWDDNFGWHYSDRDPLGVVIGNIHHARRAWGRAKGPSAVAGLKSLVHQTQSNSAYRSAAALSALMCLSTTSPTFGKFFFAIAKVEPVFFLETHANALNESYPEKKLFLALVALGRSRLPSRERDLKQTGSETARSLRQDLMRVLDLDQSSHHDAILALSNICLLLAKIRRALEENIYESDFESISDTTYFLFVLALINFDRALNYMGGAQQFGDLVLSICVEWFHELAWSILQWFTRSQHFPLLYKLYSPFLVVKDSRAMILFDGIYYSISGFNITEKLPPRWLPRKFEGNVASMFEFHITATTSRSRRLLNSLCELKREARASKPRFEYFTSLWKAGLFAPYQMWKEDPERSRRRALLVPIHKSDLVREFVSVRGDPWSWILYKGDCHQRRSWGEYLRCNIDWEWDTGSCLKRLFKVNKWTGNPSPQSATSSERQIETYRIKRDMPIRGTVKAGGTQEAAMKVSIEGIHACLPRTIKVSYVDTDDVVRFRTYHLDGSAEDDAAEPDFDTDIERARLAWPNGVHEEGLFNFATYATVDRV